MTTRRVSFVVLFFADSFRLSHISILLPPDLPSCVLPSQITLLPRATLDGIPGVAVSAFSTTSHAQDLQT